MEREQWEKEQWVEGIKDWVSVSTSESLESVWVIWVSMSQYEPVWFSVSHMNHYESVWVGMSQRTMGKKNNGEQWKKDMELISYFPEAVSEAVLIILSASGPSYLLFLILSYLLYLIFPSLSYLLFLLCWYCDGFERNVRNVRCWLKSPMSSSDLMGVGSDVRKSNDCVGDWTHVTSNQMRSWHSLRAKESQLSPVANLLRHPSKKKSTEKLFISSISCCL